MGFAIRDLGSQLGEGSTCGSKGLGPIPKQHVSHKGSHWCVAWPVGADAAQGSPLPPAHAGSEHV